MYFSVHHLYFAKGVYGEDEELLAFQRIMCKSLSHWATMFKVWDDCNHWRHRHAFLDITVKGSDTET